MFKIKIATDNAAFSESPEGLEVARILESLARKIRNDGLFAPVTMPLVDVNGNKVGEAVFS